MMSSRNRLFPALLLGLALACSGQGSDPDPTDAIPAVTDAVGDLTGDSSGLFCQPGASRCSAEGGVETCLEDGSAFTSASPCIDGNPCTEDGCVEGVCHFGAPCDDDDPCTLDICQPFTGDCTHEPDPGVPQCCQDDSDCDDGRTQSEDLCDAATGNCINNFATTEVEFLYRLGAKGAGPGQFANPKGLHVLQDGRILVADSGNHRAVFLSAAGEQLLEVTEAAGKPLKAPGCAYQAPDGTIFVCDTGNDRVLLLETDGSFRAVWPPADSGVAMFEGPSDVGANESGDIYVTDGPGEDFDSGNRVIHMNDKGQVKKEHGKTGEAPGNFDKPSGLAVAPGGNVFVADQGNDRIQVFGPAIGEPITVFGVAGSEEGQLKGVSDIAIDGAGKVYVADNGNQRIQMLAVCQPDCTERLCGSDGCGGTCGGCPAPFLVCAEGGSCPAFGECSSTGMCSGWGEPGEASCEDHSASETPAGCGGCPAEACVCTGEGALSVESYYEEGATSDPYCCETAWDGVCALEAQFVCGFECPLPEDIEWPQLEPTFAPIASFNQSDKGPLTSPIKLALAPGGFVYVLDTVKAEILVFRVKLP
jgi:sugar lactone lactonase YvrE